MRPPANEEHREDSRPGEHEIVASPGEAKHHEPTPAHEQARPHQGVPRPAEREGAEFVKRGDVGPVEATGRPAGGPVSEQVGGRAFGPEPASRPDAQIVGVQPRGPAANTGEAGSRLIETEAWSVQRALTEAVNLLAFDRLSNVLDSLPARMVEMGLVVERVAGFIAGVRPSGGAGERGPPQGPPSPASNLPGNALSGAGSPGGGFEPLPAVLALILVAAVLRGRFWPTYEHARPKLVPRLIPERPG